jgi:uncharacterized membrane protein YbhN (UPF0104 family)
VLLAVCVFAALSFLGDVRALGASLSAFSYTALATALGLVLGNYAVRFMRWQYYLRTLSVRVEPGLSALVFVAGFVMSVTPGKMGEVFKSVLLHQYRGISIARTAPVVVAERLLDLVALVVLVSVGSTAFSHGRTIALLGALVVLGIVLGCTVRPVAELGFGLLERLGPARRIVPKLREAYGALQELTRTGPFVAGAAYALFGWTLECAATYVLVSGFPDTHVAWDGATFSYAAGTLAGALAMLPGGLGVAEVGMSGLLRAADPGLSLATAAAATILVRLSTLWFGVALGAVGLLLLKTFVKRPTDTTPSPSAVAKFP